MPADTAQTSRLRPSTDDIEIAKHDLDSTGVTVMHDVFSNAEVAEALANVIGIAAQEREEGTAIRGLMPYDQPNQRIYGLIHKAGIFRRMACNPKMLAIAHHLLGERIVLYATQCHIVGPGGQMLPHYDQAELQPTIPYPCVATVMLMLEDFTEAGGATRVAVNSNKVGANGIHAVPESVEPVEGPAGTLIAYDGLLWHSAGINTLDSPRHGLLFHFCRPWIRQFENLQRTVSASVLKTYPSTLRDLLGIHEGPIGRRWLSSDPNASIPWIQD